MNVPILIFSAGLADIIEEVGGNFCNLLFVVSFVVHYHLFLHVMTRSSGKKFKDLLKMLRSYQTVWYSVIRGAC